MTKKTNNDPQNITHKTKDRGTRTPLKSESELRCFGRESSSCSTSCTCRATLGTNEERTGKCLRQVEHIRGHLLHRCSVTVTEVMVATVKLSK